MVRREKDINKDEEVEGANEPWGTLEELLLACAVNRHGSDSWDSIAMELQKRTFHHHLRAFYSPSNCKRKYGDLRRRFTGGDDGDDERKPETMVEELRKLRVAELRQEVERHDVSIEFLQSKVRRLEEEREQGFKPKEEEKVKETDLPDEPDNQEPVGNSPAEVPGRSVTGEDSDDRANRSFNESNSTSDQKGENRVQVRKSPETKRDMYKPASRRSKPKRTGSKPDSVSSLTLKLTDAKIKADPDELRNPVTEPKHDCLKMMKRRRRSRFPIASSSGEDEPEGEKISAAAKQIAIESPPLINKILVILRSHENSSLFERRLPSQEKQKYRKLIRQHMDLQTVQSRVDKGFYRGSQRKFFRDLLLLFTNFIVFFPRGSPENIAARELRKVVTKEMGTAAPVPLKPDPNERQPAPNKAAFVKAAAPPPRPMLVCQTRRSSNPVRAAKTKEAEANLKGRYQTHRLANNNKAEEKVIKKGGTRERPELSRRTAPRTSIGVRNRRNLSDDEEEDELETRGKRRESTKKKNGGSGYSTRMRRQNSSSKAVKVISSSEGEDSEDEEGEDETEREEEVKRRDRRGGDERRERIKSTGGGESEEKMNGRRAREREPERRRGQRDLSSQGKRGRPPKRSPVAVEPRSEVARGKRGREGRDSEEVTAAVAESGRSRKRSRR